MVSRMKIDEFEGGLLPDPEGYLVYYDDYAELEAAVLREKRRVDSLHQCINERDAQFAEARELLAASEPYVADAGDETLLDLINEHFYAAVMNGEYKYVKRKALTGQGDSNAAS